MAAIPTPSLQFGKVGATSELSTSWGDPGSVMGAPEPSPGQTHLR